MSNITGEAAGSFSSGSTGEELHHHYQQDHFHGSSSGHATTTNSNGSISEQPPVKKKRNLPGTPDPNAEVIALSPKTLMATNRFVCEICSKGFQRDQNLQLHRRGHNLPWKLKQRGAHEIRKRVYICPEKTCVHHNPARALGDLTGIKKHFCRKHGEKKWKCDKCSKKYAVQSDWKAHSKTCGTKEYKCDCGTIFSRRDSFITHGAFCDALTEEKSKVSHGLTSTFGGSLQGQVSELISSLPITNKSIRIPEFSHQESKNPVKSLPKDLMSMQLKSPNMTGGMFSNSFGDLRNMSSSSSCLQLSANSNIINGFQSNKTEHQLGGSSAHMSATALLQKAAQMGATTSNTISSPMMKTTSFSGGISQTGGMHGGGFGNQFLQKGPEQISSQFFNTISMLTGAGDQSHGVLKNIEHENSNSDSPSRMLQGRSSGNLRLGVPNRGQNVAGASSSFGGDMMTLDFLGIGGSRSANLREQQRQGVEFEVISQQKLQGMHPFQQQISPGQAAMEKSFWDI
ncbi:hypothetical protein NE237_014542 [Protea cynaroides]|uniref:C2H2-type domain-containing protein n=1 Tax=Protea cynaroides TaxID=273540 RepID=A0A9Q0KC94_9MAGN|nr:hypothetical protein NE237_014542 [Protea cynaroides]